MKPYTIGELLKFETFAKILYERKERTDRGGNRSGYTPDRLPFKTKRAYQGRGGKKLEIATRVAYRSHESIRPDTIPEYTQEKDYRKRVEGRNLMAKIVKPVEEKWLKYWAEKVGLMLDNEEFDRKWIEQGRRGETENAIYYDEPSNRWFKRNNLSYHTTYLEFFYRLALHNELFHGTGYSLEGFVMNDGELQPVISQPHVKASAGASSVEVEEMMKKLNYEKIPGSNNDYINKQTGIRVEDMHDENVLRGENGDLFVVDPVIFMDDEGKVMRISGKLPQEFQKAS